MRKTFVRALILALLAAGLVLIATDRAAAWQLIGAAMVFIAFVTLDSITRAEQQERTLQVVEALKEENRATTTALETATAIAESITSSNLEAADGLRKIDARLDILADVYPALQQAVKAIAESIPSGEKQVSERINAFALGILEEIAQSQIDSERRARAAAKNLEHKASEYEALIALYGTLRPDRPLPNFGGWAVSADVARRLVSAIFSSTPEVVLDVGSGISTLLAAKTLERLGGTGRVIALEHDASWADETKDLIAQHGLEHRATVIHAPITEQAIGHEILQWYDLTSDDIPRQIDILFVDGPPQAVGPMARYPTLPLLRERLTTRTIILLDDADRPEEQKILERWMSEFPEWKLTLHNDQKGTAELRRAIG